MVEWLGSTNVRNLVFDNTLSNICQLSGQSPGSTYHVVVSWDVSLITWTVNGTQVCSSPNSPNVAMFPYIDFMAGGASGTYTGTFPQTLVVQYLRICPVGTVTCDQAHATMFDEEFNETTTPTTVYVAQNALGNNTGLDAADAFGMFNFAQAGFPLLSGYWGSVIGPGTNVYLVGTANGDATNKIKAYTNGTTSMPINFYTSPGSKFTGCLDVNGHSNVNAGAEVNLCGGFPVPSNPGFSASGNVLVSGGQVQ